MKLLLPIFTLILVSQANASEVFQCTSSGTVDPALYQMTIDFEEATPAPGSFFNPVTVFAHTVITGPRTETEFLTTYRVTGFYKRIGFSKQSFSMLTPTTQVRLHQESFNNEGPLNHISASLVYNKQTADEIVIRFKCKKIVAN